MIIYPKTSEYVDGINSLKKYITKYKGIEIQILSWEDSEIYKIENIIKKVKAEIPEINEITIHPPLKSEFDFEVLSYINLENEIKRIENIVKVSREYNIKMNLLYHTTWKFSCWKNSNAINNMNCLLKIIQNTNVNILIENIFSMSYDKHATVLEIAKAIDNPHLKVCLDICHLHVQANIFDLNFEEFLNEYLNKEECRKYIYQIHFAATIDNDGYRRKKETHGRRHRNIKDLKEDYGILTKFGIEDKIIVTEVSEDDYSTRVDQLEEIKTLELLNS